MKKTIYLILIMLVFSACIKYPEWDNPGTNGLAVLYTNYYILTEINPVLKRDTVSYTGSAILLNDTVKYNKFFIQTFLDGNLISENTAFSGTDCSDEPNPYCVPPEEQKYFVNKIQSIEISANKPYNTNENNFAIYFRDKELHYTQKNYIGEELGYTPLKTELTAPPDSSQWFVFTIKITDDKNNVFTSSTDSIFVLN
ncbi:MAG: hypothetical protein GXO80_02720 [Chlorobi bacterium]|nr:hypothetical protein [Chlorobiota bacterium]